MKKYLYPFICLIIHSILRLFSSKTEKRYDVAIVRSDKLGDFIIWASTFESYRKKYLGKRILFVCSKELREIPHAAGLFTDVLTYDQNKLIYSPRYHIRVMKQMKKIYADEVINPAWSHQFAADFICDMIQAPRKIGTKVIRETTVGGIVDTLYMKVLNSWTSRVFNGYFTELVDMPPLNTVTEFDAIEFFTKKIVDPAYTYKLSDITFITDKYNCPFSGDFALISLSSSREIKDWPNERVAEVIDAIPFEYTVVLSGYGRKDEQKAAEIENLDQGRHRLVNFVGKTTVEELIGLISHASFVMGNDSAAVHIAAASRVYSICYMHGAHYPRFVPYPDWIPERQFHPRCVFHKMDCFGCLYHCDKDYHKDQPYYCLREITVEMVKNELLKLLDEIRGNKADYDRC